VYSHLQEYHRSAVCTLIILLTKSHLLVAIAHKEIGIELTQVQRNMANAVSSVDHTQDAVLLAHPCQALEWEANSWNRDDSIEDGDSRNIAIVDDARDGLREGIEDVGMSAGESVSKILAGADLAQRDLRVGLDDRSKSFLNGAIDGVEVENAVLLLVHQIPQDCVDTYG
jgi:hypothetical protein